MEQWLAEITRNVALVIEAMAMAIIAVSSLVTFVSSVRVMFARPTGRERRALWLSYARWLVAGLTFQLAADVVHSSIAPTWDDIGHLAAIAFIRTFLSYFLERDLAEINAVQRERTEEPLASREAGRATP
jgi:uncharacterized membrane protein